MNLKECTNTLAAIFIEKKMAPGMINHEDITPDYVAMKTNADIETGRQVIEAWKNAQPGDAFDEAFVARLKAEVEKLTTPPATAGGGILDDKPAAPKAVPTTTQREEKSRANGKPDFSSLSALLPFELRVQSQLMRSGAQRGLEVDLRIAQSKSRKARTELDKSNALRAQGKRAPKGFLSEDTPAAIHAWCEAQVSWLDAKSVLQQVLRSQCGYRRIQTYLKGEEQAIETNPVDGVMGFNEFMALCRMLDAAVEQVQEVEMDMLALAIIMEFGLMPGSNPPDDAGQPAPQPPVPTPVPAPAASGGILD